MFLGILAVIFAGRQAEHHYQTQCSEDAFMGWCSHGNELPAGAISKL
jgi:hypothetical protein